MTTQLPIHIGLRFFGEMTASVSHEIKNRMAVINEQAGLLEDFLGMAERGRPLDPDRLKRLAKNVKTQISMADDIIRTMNRFAHSADALWLDADVAEIPLLSAALARRLARSRNIALDAPPPEGPARAETSPFLLMNLIWSCLDGLMAAGLRETEIAIRTEAGPESVRVLLHADAAPETWRELLERDPTASLLAALGAEATVPAEAGSPLTLSLPKKRADFNAAIGASAA